MTQSNQTSDKPISSGTVIFLGPRLGRRPASKPEQQDKRLRSWLVLFVLMLAIVVPPTLAAFTAIFALWLFALSLALALIIFADLARRSVRWARSPVPA
jgi:hypothetical protein